jgi:hypothetical protein
MNKIPKISITEINKNNYSTYIFNNCIIHITSSEDQKITYIGRFIKEFILFGFKLKIHNKIII